MMLNKVLKIASSAGKMILENGGETYRAEDVVARVSSAYDATSDCFATLSGIIVSITKDEETVSTVIRIKSRTINLEKIHQINDIAREAKNYSYEEFAQKLKDINMCSRYSFPLNLLAHALVAACFSVVFGGTSRDFWGTLPIGASIYLLSYSFSKYELNGIFVNTLGGATSAFLAHYFYSLGLIENIDKSIIGTLMLLVPGIALTNGIRDIIAGDYMTGMARGTEAILIAASIAVGTGAAISISLGGKF